jgi:alpha-1,3/alpha-1,6-mannosyltransferase
MGFADAVAVNSEFTKGVVEQVWPELGSRAGGLKVVYPCVDVLPSEADLLPATLKLTDGKSEGESELLFADERVILSINRFERKKDVGLAIRAFAALPAATRKGVRLVIAGGYDTRVQENVAHHAELEQLAESLNLHPHTYRTVVSASAAPADADVLFLLSIPNPVKLSLLKRATLLVYTPANEHFGIVPLEAMLAGTPVLAADTGGPRETVLDGRTGWLRDPMKPELWTAVMREALALSPADRARIAREATRRVKTGFSRERMAERLDRILDGLETLQRRPPLLNAVLNFAVILVTFALGLWLAQWYASVHRKRAH